MAVYQLQQCYFLADFPSPPQQGKCLGYLGTQWNTGGFMGLKNVRKAQWHSKRVTQTTEATAITLYAQFGRI